MAFYNVFHVLCERLFPLQGHNYFLQNPRTQSYVETLSDFCRISVSGEHFKEAVWARRETWETEVLRFLTSHSAGVKFRLAFMNCLKSKVNLHFSEGPLMKQFHYRSSNLIYNVSSLHEGLVVILQRFKFWGHSGCT